MSTRVSNVKRMVGDRTWDDKIVVDATKELRVFILPEDVAKATIKDPACCVFAQACKRSFQAVKVLFYRTTAYIELPYRDGTTRVERFTMPKLMRQLIVDFDTGKKDIPSAGFLLTPPPPGRTLDALASKSRRAKKNRTERDRRKRKILGEKTVPLANQPIQAPFQVRNGTGAVHFIPKPEPKK